MTFSAEVPARARRLAYFARDFGPQVYRSSAIPAVRGPTPSWSYTALAGTFPI